MHKLAQCLQQHKNIRNKSIWFWNRSKVNSKFRLNIKIPLATSITIPTSTINHNPPISPSQQKYFNFVRHSPIYYQINYPSLRKMALKCHCSGKQIYSIIKWRTISSRDCTRRKQFRWQTDTQLNYECCSIYLLSFVSLFNCEFISFWQFSRQWEMILVGVLLRLYFRRHI